MIKHIELTSILQNIRFMGTNYSHTITVLTLINQRNKIASLFFNKMEKERQTCAYSSEGLYDHPLVVIGTCGRLQNVQENLFEEHLQTEAVKK